MASILSVVFWIIRFLIFTRPINRPRSHLTKNSRRGHCAIFIEINTLHACVFALSREHVAITL